MSGNRRDDPRPATDELKAHIDAANRLETSIERQITLINGIDDKAEHITRLVGILLGLIFTIVSLAVQLGGVTKPRLSTPVMVTFVVGIFFLVVTMAFAIITYLSSTFRIGLHENVGYYLADPSTNTTYNQHIRRALGSYGRMIQQNKAVINTNSRRFRMTLTSLLLGTIYVTTTGTLYITQFGYPVTWMILTFSTTFAFLIGWYIITGQYLTLDGVSDINV